MQRRAPELTLMAMSILAWACQPVDRWAQTDPGGSGAGSGDAGSGIVTAPAPSVPTATGSGEEMPGAADLDSSGNTGSQSGAGVGPVASSGPDSGVTGAQCIPTGPRDCSSALDNDCDGQPDNVLDDVCRCTPGAVEACDEHPGFDGLGLCKPGTRTCIVGADAGSGSSDWGACEGAVAPGPEDLCGVRGDDTDCDGLPNEGCACVEGEPLQCGSSTDVGVCAFGTATCVNGAFGQCVGAVPPAPRDSCVRGDDSNCNGIPNEGCACIDGETRPCGPPSVGICRQGVQTCVNGAFNGECVGLVPAGTRNCNSPADSDCDGRPDNTTDDVCRCAVGTSQACGTHPQDGIGPCRAESQQCVTGPGNASSAFGPCTGSIGPAPADLCDGSDTNCNGQSDDSCGSPEGSECTNNSDCDNNTDCVTFYGDGDEDGFAAADAIETALRVCASATFRLPQFTRVRPASRATTDCLDTNDVVKPGQTAFFTAPVLGLTPAFDYDCDGIEADPTNNKVSDCNDQTIVSCVDRGGWSGAPPACGQTGGIQPCGEPEDTVGLCALFPGGPSSPRQCH